MLKIKFNYALIFLAILFVSPKTINAQSLNFDPKTSAPKVGETVTVKVVIDAGTRQIAGSDAYVIYDSSMLSVQSITGGDYFPISNNTPSKDKLYIYGIISNAAEYKTGSGTLATIVFKAEKTGTTKVTFVCDLTAKETSKINTKEVNSQNIIDCSKTGDHTVTVSSGTLSPTAAATSAPTSMPQAGFSSSTITYSAIGAVMLVVALVSKFYLLS